MKCPIRHMVTATLFSTLLPAASLPAMAAADNNCDIIKEQIAQRIISNGVPADTFTLTVVANDQAQTAQGKEVGYCGHQHYTIFYQRQAASAKQPAQQTAPR